MVILVQSRCNQVSVSENIPPTQSYFKLVLEWGMHHEFSINKIYKLY